MSKLYESGKSRLCTTCGHKDVEYKMEVKWDGNPTFPFYNCGSDKCEKFRMLGRHGRLEILTLEKLED